MAYRAGTGHGHGTLENRGRARLTLSKYRTQLCSRGSSILGDLHLKTAPSVVRTRSRCADSFLKPIHHHHHHHPLHHHHYPLASSPHLAITQHHLHHPHQQQTSSSITHSSTTQPLITFLFNSAPPPPPGLVSRFLPRQSNPTSSPDCCFPSPGLSISSKHHHANLCEDPYWQECAHLPSLFACLVWPADSFVSFLFYFFSSHHSGGRIVRYHRQCQVKNPGQRGHPAGSAAVDFCRETT